MKYNFPKNRSLCITSVLRKELAKPFGRLMDTKGLMAYLKKGDIVYAIGDVTLDGLLRQGFTPKVGIFDYRTERSTIHLPIINRAYPNPIHVDNKRGEISAELWKAVQKASKSKSDVGIRVHGEEDLASLACIYFAKEGSIVVYGMRGKGMSVIRINKKIKNYIVKVLKRM